MGKAMREAELTPRAGDERLSPEQLLRISVFQGLKPASLERYPGAVVLRRYGPGDIVCRQGDAGWTAFFILTRADLVAVRQGAAEPGGEDRSRAAETAQLAEAERAHARLMERDPALLQLPPAEKRRRADEVSGADEELAGLLRAAADGDAQRECASVSISVPSRRAVGQRSGGLIRGLLHGLFGVRRRALGSTQSYIPIDAPVDLSHTRPAAMLHEGELFGEMSCMNRYPRSATVRATRDCYMIEMLRNILEVLQKNKAFKEQMDGVYRRRVLGTHLRSLPIFSEVSEECLARLAPRVELVEKEPGEVIFKEGDPADSMYVIRIGMVKVTKQEPGGERVLAYRGRGEYIGEIGVMHGAPRMATCTALDHPVFDGATRRRSGRIELIRISRADVESLFAQFPEVKSKVEAVAEERSKPISEAAKPLISLSPEFDRLGLMQGQKLMLIDLEKCTRCDECVRACVSTHEDGRLRLLREGPRFGRYLVPNTCRMCLDPVCMIGCPVGSIHKGETGEIIIEDWCIGCEICAKQCPYDAINMFELSARAASEGDDGEGAKQAVVCDQCSSLADGVPSCVYACPHDAALRVDARAFFAGQIGAARRM